MTKAISAQKPGTHVQAYKTSGVMEAKVYQPVMGFLISVICARLPAFVLQFVISLDLRPPWNFAACAGIFYVCWICVQHIGTKIVFLDYSLGMEIGAIAMDAIHLTLLVRPLHEFRRLKQTESAHTLPWFERFKWASELCGSPRGIGWNHQVKNLPENSAKSRTEFVFSRLATAVKHYVCFDIGLFYLRQNPVFQSPAAFASHTMFFRRALDCGIFLWTYYFLGIAVHSLIVALVMSCTSAELDSWRSPFGNWEDAYTIRRFWGRTWHQFLRRYLAPFGKKLAIFLGFKTGTTGSSYTQLYTAFFASAITHFGGDAVINPSHIGFSSPFFIYQPIAITFEDMIIGAARRAGVKETEWTRAIGYLWVTSWFIVTATNWVSVLAVVGAENGGVVAPLQYLPPSLFGILVNL